jgi:hypothetical protein
MTNLHPSPSPSRRIEYVVTLWLHLPSGALRIEQPVVASHPEYAAQLAGVMWAQMYAGVALTVEIASVETMAMSVLRNAPKPGKLAALRRWLSRKMNPDQ